MNGWIIAYWVINAMCLAVIMAKHGEETRHNFFSAFIGFALTQFLLYMGGAFS